MLQPPIHLLQPRLLKCKLRMVVVVVALPIVIITIAVVVIVVTRALQIRSQIGALIHDINQTLQPLCRNCKQIKIICAKEEE